MTIILFTKFKWSQGDKKKNASLDFAADGLIARNYKNIYDAVHLQLIWHFTVCDYVN